ncbi:MAG: amino acid ABC transporter permease [Coriobacteriales bacterium]|nr:amino acid ABC transporter permease [Coriobacteriales bacterium]
MREGLGHKLTRLVAACVAALFVLAVLPARAQALTTSKATARPNEDGGTAIIGGLPTRLTWEGTVDAGEKVSGVTLALSEGSDFNNSTTKITALEGLNRTSIQGEAKPNGSSLAVTFSEPVGEGMLIRLEVEGMTFPASGGDIVVGGTYTNQKGEQQLQDSKPISIIENTPLQAMVNDLDQQEWVKAWNSNQFLGMFLKPQILLTSLFSLFPGWLLCLLIVIVAYPFAILLGLVFALMKISKFRILRAIAIVYINVLRGTPLFLQIYIMFFGLPMMNIVIDNTVLGIIVMAINSSAYLAEIFRAGIESIPTGQYEAAASLGMSRMRTMVSIILPQTVRRVIPTVTSDFIMAFKDTSLLSSVGVMELMMFAKNLTSVSGNMTPYVAAAIFYLIVTLPLIKVVTIIEKRMANSERGGGPRPKAKGAQANQADDAAESDSADGAEVSLSQALGAPFRAGTSIWGGVADV